jgi:hypothetical protein
MSKSQVMVIASTLMMVASGGWAVRPSTEVAEGLLLAGGVLFLISGISMASEQEKA